MNDSLANVVERFRGKSIVVVGDLVADQFLSGTISRVSREAPVFILRHDNTDTFAGGAANAAVNIASLGGNPILIGVVGDDANGELLRKALIDSGVDCSSVETINSFRTTTKVRVLAGQHYAPKQQVIRIDYENQNDAANEVADKLVATLEKVSETANAIIVSDYNYGVVTPKLFEVAREISKRRGISLVVDSRFRLGEFTEAASATPNQDEVEQILGKGFTENDCIGLLETLGHESLLVTRGNKGMLLFKKGNATVAIEPVGSLEPVDVTGAGDTVIAAYALGLASGLGFAKAAMIANHAGGIVVMKKGTASVSVSELERSLAGIASVSARSS
ncbi:MAG TPA: PfkB family carbohydrate kinase [Pyrinomonadaceae bacterium]|nr:PfkB family carbohydrate kinase [Pyrinomonadaceae bacterium]